MIFVNFRGVITLGSKRNNLTDLFLVASHLNVSTQLPSSLKWKWNPPINKKGWKSEMKWNKSPTTSKTKKTWSKINPDAFVWRGMRLSSEATENPILRNHDLFATKEVDLLGMEKGWRDTTSTFQLPGYQCVSPLREVVVNWPTWNGWVHLEGPFGGF